MTEREKMLSGALYASEDPELAAARIRARTCLLYTSDAADE